MNAQPLRKQEDDILEHFNANPWKHMTLRDVATATKVGLSSVRFYVPDMCRRGLVERVSFGVYRAAPKDTTE